MQHAQKNGQAAGWELISRYPGTPVECPSKLLCPSICMYVRTQEQVNGFSWNLVWGGGSLKFINMLNFSQNWITIINNNGHFVIRSTCISALQSHSMRVPHAYRKPCVPDRPLVRDPIKTLLEYPYELGVWDFDPIHILILIEVWC
jgi:hypothetical protein